MAEHEADENRTPDSDGQPNDGSPERDLRSLMGVQVRRTSSAEGRARTARSEHDETQRKAPASPGDRAPGTEVPGPSTGTEEEEIAPPYVPPIREGDEYEERRRKLEQERQEELERQQKPEPDPEFDQKMPPVWPGDEKQPWFRRERGLPPLPESKRGDGENVDLEDLPTGLAELRTRVRAFGLSVVVPNVIGLIPVIGFVVGVVFAVVNLFLYRQGQDIGALVFKLRVVRSNGDVAGFFTMFVRSAASVISLLLLGAGYWAAYSDPHRRTWHDKWLGTYVVNDAPEYNTRRRSSSDTARTWFWIILLISIAITLMFVLATGPVPETVLEGTPPPGATEGDGPAA